MKTKSTIRCWILAGIVAGLLISVSVHAASVTLAWDAPGTYADGSPLTDLSGYRLYHGIASGTYTERIEVSGVTSATFSNLQSGCSNFFAVTAVNSAGVESGFSGEVAVYVSSTNTVAAQKDADLDGNGIPDVWEIARFGAIGVQGAGADDDSDHDGASNAQEYIAGTDPTDSKSRPEITIRMNQGKAEISFLARAATGSGYLGKTRVYTLERCHNLAGGVWENVPGGTDIMAADQSFSYLEASPAVRDCFYRVTACLL